MFGWNTRLLSPTMDVKFQRYGVLKEVSTAVLSKLIFIVIQLSEISYDLRQYYIIQ